MLETLSFIVGTAIATGAAGYGYAGTKRFVRERLRFVEEIQKPRAPLVAGGLAALVALPFTILPAISGVTVVVFGTAVGAGARAGAREIRRYIGDG